MNKKRQTLKYILCDFFSAIIAWASLFLFRKISIENQQFTDVSSVFQDANFWWGITLIPTAWLCLYTFMGTYRNIFRKSRLKELQQTAFASIFGVTILFFAFLLDDAIGTYRYYYASFLFLLLLHFTLTYSCRLFLTSHNARMIHTRQYGFPTLLIGSGEKAYNTYIALENQEVYAGQKFVGFVDLSGLKDSRLDNVMPHLGDLSNLDNLLDSMAIEEVIVAVEDNQKNRLQEIVRIVDRHEEVIIRVTPELRDNILGAVKIDSIFHHPLITINPRFMEDWQYSLKRLCDIFFSILALILLSPVFLITAILVKCSSPGPVFYAQERIGKGGKPFKMHKFRSMYIDAEKQGPALSKDNDPRITPFGKFMRKVRLDEIPQFYNVLKGTMSIVGPRPERQYFIDQIVERAPEYLLLQKVKPGITSWGQVKYGYAENVDEMVERLQYDLLYLENMSITMDIKILLYTVIIIVQGRGK